MKNVPLITLAVLLALSVQASAGAAPVKHAAAAAPSADYYANLQSPLPWHGSAFPLRVYIYPGGGIEGYKLEDQDILEAAFKDWTDGTGGRVTFTYVTRPADADIEVEWHRHLPVQTLEIGHTAITEDGNYLTKARVMLLTYNTAGKLLRPEQIKQACMHEIGHALGIKGHSQNPKDIMFAPYNFHYTKLPSGELQLVGPQPALTDRDIKTALRIYNDRWLASKGQTPKLAPTGGGTPALDPSTAAASATSLPAPAAAGGSPGSTSASKPASSIAAKPAVPNSFLPPRSTSSKPDTKYRSLVKGGIDAIKADDCDQAISLLNDALKLGDGSKMAEMNLIIALTKKANKSYAQRNYIEAADNYKSALVLRKQVYGGSDPKIAETMPAFSYSLKKVGREAEAAEFKR